MTDRASRIVEKMTWFAVIAAVLFVVLVGGFFAVIVLFAADARASGVHTLVPDQGSIVVQSSMPY